jgi:hypothetical protein
MLKLVAGGFRIALKQAAGRSGRSMKKLAPLRHPRCSEASRFEQTRDNVPARGDDTTEGRGEDVHGTLALEPRHSTQEWWTHPWFSRFQDLKISRSQDLEADSERRRVGATDLCG